MTVNTATPTTLPEHREAMRLGATEYQRLIDVLRSLEPQDWTRMTDCTLWDVRAMAADVSTARSASLSLPNGASASASARTSG